jgi:RNA polymerase sigma-70 factor (ECF subfamily)
MNGRHTPEDSRQEDRALVLAFQRGEKAAFDRLAGKHKDMVFNLCYRMTGDYDDAGDCAQEALIRAYRSLHRFRLEAGFSTWLYKIALNTCRNYLTSLRRRAARFVTRPGGLEAADPRALNPHLSLEKREREETVQQALDSLPERLKTLVVLRDVEGRSYEEIASLTGMKLGTVKSRLQRARLALRDRLKGVIRSALP